jgi:DNA-directed DNA polymerase III PolC
MPAPLHVKSHYSLGYGTASISELARRAAEAGLPGLALTDLENLYGQIQFHHACRHHGLKPLTGVELRPGSVAGGKTAEKGGRLVLLAKDRAGYQSLCEIVSRRRAGRRTSDRRGHDTESESPGQTNPGMLDEDRVLSLDPVQSLGTSAAGLFILTDDAATLARLLEHEALDRSSLRALLVRPAPAAELQGRLIEVARAHGVPIVADSDVVMLEAADHALHLLQLAIARKETVSAVRERGLAEPAERRFRTGAELELLFADCEDALEESLRIAQACELDLREASPVLPRPTLPPGDTTASHLERTCRESLERGRAEGRWVGEDYDERLGRELTTIRELGFSSYFLVVAEIAGFAMQQGIPSAGRGSAVGSLVAHLLGVTHVDPVAHGLLFERWIHPRRRDLPDIDIDLPSGSRDEVIDWVFRRFGRENVAMVGAHGTYRRRSAYREGLKALGMPLREVENYCRRIPAEDLEDLIEPPDWAAEAGAYQPRRQPAVAMPPLPQPYRHAVPLLERLIGMPHYFSVHPGGVVIADTRIAARVPLERGAKGVVAAQYDMHSIRHTGLVKIDLLGNRCLDELRESASLLETGTGSAAAPDLIRSGPWPVPEADPETIATLNRADTIGCWQLESPAMRSLLAQIPIRGVRDCIAALALVRPGAASGQAKRAFIRRANGEEPPDYLHLALEKRLRETHGVLLYEEDIMCVLSVLGGLSLEEADELRSAIEGSQDDREELERLEREFLRRSSENGIDVGTARKAWEKVLEFTAYSFSKAHASSYGLLAYQAAYMRTHFPVEFGCAVLNHHGGMYPLRTLAAAIGRWGVRLRPPGVNRSELPCTLEAEARPGLEGERAIRIGLEKVKRLTRRTLLTLLRSRHAGGPYRDLADLLTRVRMSSREVEALVLSGACDDLAPLSATVYPFAHEAVLEALKQGRSLDSLRASAAAAPVVVAEAERLKLYQSLVRIRNELTFLEMHVSDHPMRVLREEARRYGCITTTEAASRVGSFVRMAAVVAATRRLATKDRGVMQFVTLEDEQGILEAVLFPPVYRSVGSAITSPGPFLVAGTVEEDHGDVHLIVSGLKPFHERSRAYADRPRAG